MARSSQFVQVGKRKLELSNLRKVLFPGDQIVKAELIEYYLKIAPTILTHVKRRPLSVIRYPDGIEGEAFYQKNTPHWAPEWIEQVALGTERKKNYVLATEEASLVWLANLACLELHQIHAYQPHFDRPDYIVFDLDPPENTPFPAVVEIALQLREHVEGYGYHTFAKTTGRKGIHILCPIEPKWDFHTAFEAAQALGKSFVQSHAATTTLHIKKEARKGKVLVDVYRNRPSQTIVSPYSIRGAPGAPVSMPVSWDDLAGVTSPLEFDLRSVPQRVIQEGDAWEGIAAYAVELHTRRKKEAPAAAKRLPKSRKRKTPEALEKYASKREFEKTPEPLPEVAAGAGNAFVVHRHHASRLHYDLRLERDGTLKSWAVPKGMPPRPGIKRLAVATEDHPLEYLNFEGMIPKGEYGGGMMWVFAQGRYEITKQKKDGFYFRLQSRRMNAEYRMYETRNREWLLERVDKPQIDWLNDPIEPMLSHSADKPPVSNDFIYEVKWDGIRAMIAVDDGAVRIRSRSQRDITEQFPELLEPEQSLRGSGILLDTEIVCLDESGKPVFKDVINRLRHTSETAIKRGRSRHPAVCYVFDCLFLDGRPIVSEPLARRREWLTDVIRRDADNPYRLSEIVEDGDALFEAAAQIGLEGIMAKEKESTYQPGSRTSRWLKVKTRRTADCLIIGYTKGKGDRAGTFGALHIAQRDGDAMRYVGKVGTGFDDQGLAEITKSLKGLARGPRPIKERPPDDAITTWLKPMLHCEVQYASLTPAGTLREPVFLRLRPDLVAEDTEGR